MSDPRQARAALFAALAIAASLAVAAIMAYQIWSGMPSSQQGSKVAQVTLLVFPFALVAALLLPQRTRPLGFALATAVAAIALAGTAVALFFSVAWSGFGKESNPVVFVGAIFAGMIVCAIAGYRSVDRALRHPAYWIFAIILSMGYTQFLFWASDAVRRYYLEQTYAANANDRNANTLLAQWGECAAALAKAGKYPASGTSLATEGCPLPAPPSHAIRHVAGPPDARGHPGLAMVCATPHDWPRSGFVSIVASTTGRTLASPSMVERAPTCLDALPIAAPGVPRMAFCVLEHYAAKGRIPETFLAMAETSPACLHGYEVGALWARAPSMRVTYAPGIGAGGFTIVARPQQDIPYAIDGLWQESAGRIGPGASASTMAPKLLRPEMPPQEEIESKCATGDADACYYLGYQMVGGYAGRKMDRVAGKAMLERSCAMGSGEGCAEFALQRFRDEPPGILTSEETVKRNQVLLPLYLRACQLRSASGCSQAASILKRGSRVPEDVAARIAQRERDAGQAWRPPTPIERDPGKALSLLRRGCELGYDTACVESGELAMETAPGPESVKLALDALAPHCQHGDAPICFRMARMLREPGPFQDLPRALETFFHACDTSPPYGCKEAAELWPAVAERPAIVADLMRQQR